MMFDQFLDKKPVNFRTLEKRIAHIEDVLGDILDSQEEVLALTRKAQPDARLEYLLADLEDK